MQWRFPWWRIHILVEKLEWSRHSFLLLFCVWKSNWVQLTCKDSKHGFSYFWSTNLSHFHSVHLCSWNRFFIKIKKTLLINAFFTADAIEFTYCPEICQGRLLKIFVSWWPAKFSTFWPPSHKKTGPKKAEFTDKEIVQCPGKLLFCWPRYNSDDISRGQILDSKKWRAFLSSQTVTHSPKYHFLAIFSRLYLVNLLHNKIKTTSCLTTQLVYRSSLNLWWLYVVVASRRHCWQVLDLKGA